MAEGQTEAATPRRLQRAREEGKVPVSHELGPLLLLGGAGVGMLLAAPGPGTLALLRGLIQRLAGSDDPASINGAVHAALAAGTGLLLPIFALALFAGAGSVLVQTGFLIHPAALLPDLGRIGPRRGLARVFGPASLFHAARAFLKTMILGLVYWRVLGPRLPDLLESMRQTPEHLPARFAALIAVILLAAAATQAAAAGLDIVLTRLRHARGLRMSRQEIRQEHREATGSPEIKARIRRLRLQRARRRMAQAVRAATVVVTNPTHYAVALEYDQARGMAPVVVAKGVDEMAARIRAIARDNGVPLVANPPLARALHRVELETQIPPELYQTVAELIAYVWRLQGRARRRA